MYARTNPHILRIIFMNTYTRSLWRAMHAACNIGYIFNMLYSLFVRIILCMYETQTNECRSNQKTYCVKRPMTYCCGPVTLKHSCVSLPVPKQLSTTLLYNTYNTVQCTILYSVQYCTVYNTLLQIYGMRDLGCSDFDFFSHFEV